MFCVLHSLIHSFVSPGENADGGKGLRQQAGEIMACKYYIHIELL